MQANYREVAFEEAIEKSLIENGGYSSAEPSDFDRSRALFPSLVVDFVRNTQLREWCAIKEFYGDGAEARLLDDLCTALDGLGALHVLRHGFKCYGKQISIAYFRPVTGINPETQRLYSANRLTVTRQLKYSLKNENSVDVALCVNGLPVATLELKNPLTGQNVQHAMTQYRRDRDPRDPLFTFEKRTLVHFAVDPDLVYMTTRLAESSTHFLPFNRGRNHGAGNPDGTDYPTSYLWENVLCKDSMMDILHRFLHLQKNEKRQNKSLIFPRYHQLDSVRKLEASALALGAGQNYLVQHSAGSGKSNSIAWLAYRLSTLHDSSDHKVFDSVIVVTDRRVLDQQLQDTIYQFEHRKGVVQKIDQDSSQLAIAITQGVPIIVTTLQKFPYVTEKVDELPQGRYAVIVDEAHSSQSGEGAADLKGVLSGAEIIKEAKRLANEAGLPDYEEEVIKAMKKRGKQKNISFFAFTATPKHKTLKVFGQPGLDEKPLPFHVYSMRQAIEEGFILDVLKHYMTYQRYYGLVKAVADDPEVDKRKAAQALRRYVNAHPHNIEQKTAIMVEHFRQAIRGKINGKAKAMVVTSGRLQAVHYKEAFDRYILEHGYKDIKALVAFSGIVEDPVTHKVYAETQMNGLQNVKELPEKFASDEYQILIVAEKYQTGFDQPLLHTMYVDKKLSGVQAVQTLSRLNRTCPGKEDTFVLDFVNTAEEIQEAFQPYFESPLIGKEADVSQLYILQKKLDDMRVYYLEEMQRFCAIFFKPKAKQYSGDHAQLIKYTNPSIDRYNELEEEDKDLFRKDLTAFRNLYSLLSNVMDSPDADLEKHYAFYRFLLLRLPVSTGPRYDFTDDVALKFYRLQKSTDGSILLEPGITGELIGPTETGTGETHGDKAALSSLITILNERFGTQFTPTDQLFLDQVEEDAYAMASIRQAAMANNYNNFSYPFEEEMKKLRLQRMGKNQDIVTMLLENSELRDATFEELGKKVYNRVHQTLDTGFPTTG